MTKRGKYLALADALAEMIRRELSPGDQLPTVTALARRFDVAPNTVSRAIQTLKQKGLLSGKTGGKTRVRVPPAETVRRNTRYHLEKELVLRPEEERRGQGVAELDSGIPVTSLYEDHVQIDVISCPKEVAEDLGLAPGEKVMRRIGVRRHRKGAGASKSVSYMPYSVVSKNPEILDVENEPWPGGSLHQLYTTGIEASRIEDHVTATMPTEEEVREQDIPPQVPLLHIRKITYDTDDRPVEVAYIPLPADRTKLIYVTPLKPWSLEKIGTEGED